MAVIAPTVTAEDPRTYRTQIERVSGFADRLHLDFMDGLFTRNKSIELHEAWRPEGLAVDLHLMYMRPDLYISELLRLQPELVVVHAEAKGVYGPFAAKLHRSGIKAGVALLQDTPVSLIADHLAAIDHVLVFSGDLGHFGGNADLSFLGKVRELKQLKPDIEIGWDGGINKKNVHELVRGGVDVLNVGGAIQRAADPRKAFDTLRSLTRS